MITSIENHLEEQIKFMSVTDELALNNFTLTEEHCAFLADLFKGSKGPASITLKNCMLKSIPDFITHCKDLIILDLSGNKIKETNIEWKNHNKLTIVDLSNNPLENINNIEDCSALKVLLLNNTLISHIPKTWAKATFRALEMAHHKIKDAETDIKNLPETLYKLVLTNGKFKVGALQVGHLRHIQTLDISGNGIIEIHKDISFCKNIKSIDFSNNQLAGHPGNL